MAMTLYEADEHRWIEEQIEALRSGRIDQIDREHLIELLTDMTIRDRRELRSRLTILLLHILKTRFEPERLSRSWISTILAQQSELRALLEGIPSIAQYVPDLLPKSYDDALRRAARETGLPRSQFPASCPWSIEEVLAYEPPDPPQRRSASRA